MFAGETAVCFHRHQSSSRLQCSQQLGGVQASLSANDFRQKAQNKTPTIQLCFWIASQGLWVFCLVFFFVFLGRNCLQQNSLCRVSINFLAISFFSRMSNGDYEDAVFFEDTHIFFFLTVAFADDPLGPLRLIFQMKVYFVPVSLFKSTLKRHLLTQVFGG